MSEEEKKASEELFKDVKFYVVGDIDPEVVQLLKAGKGKEVSYNALATHIIAEDGDNPEVSESREVFDLPVVKPSWVILSVRCGDLLPVTGFSPESGQIFFGVTACLPRIPEDLNSLWAYVTFYGGNCQLNLNRKVTHLVVQEPKGVKYECALKHPGIRIVTPDWITDSVKDKSRRDEALYHPRLTYTEPEEQSEEESDQSSSPRRSQGSSSSESSPRRRPGPKKFNSVSPPPPRKPERRHERMFDDSDDDSSTEKEGPNLNWTPAEVTPGLGTARRRAGPPGTREPPSATAAAGGGPGASGMINLCASIPVHAPGAGAVPEGRPAATPMNQAPPPGAIPGGPEAMPGWSPAARTLRNITNSSDMQQSGRPGTMLHPKLSGQPLPGDRPVPHPPVPQQQFTSQGAHPAHHPLHLQNQHHIMQLHHQQQLQQQQQGQVPGQMQGPIQVQGGQGFPHPMAQQQHPMAPQHPHQMAQAQQLPLSQQQRFLQHPQLRPQHPLHPLQQQRLHLLQQQQQQNQQQTQPQQHPQARPHPLQQAHPHPLQQAHFLHQAQHPPHLQTQHPNLQTLQSHPQVLQQQQQGAPLSTQLYGHEPGQEVPVDGFLVGCVFAIADYPEQMADKQLLATWKRVIQACGGVADTSLTSRCTHLLCESQVSNLYVQALREGKRCVTAHWLNTILKKKKMVPPSRTLHLPFAFPPGAKPCSQHIISVTGFVDSDRDDLKLMAYLSGARYTGYLCRGNTVLICKEPSGLKYEKAKEWKIPCVNAQWLCDVLLGNFEALRQIQHSRYQIYNHPEPLAPNPQLVINLLAAWRAPIKVTPEALANLQLQRQKLNNSEPALKKARMDEVQSPSKKLPPESTPLVMFTGLEPNQVLQYTKWVQALGGEVADSTHKVTHLLACKVARTVKFLTAMSVVKHIVTPQWLEESWRSQKFVDEPSFTLRDAEAEVLFNFSLEESLKRAQSSQLFKGKFFYLTPGICPSLSTMKAILESAGGKLLPKLPSSKKVLEHRQNKNLPEIILVSCDNDLHLLREYFLKNIDVHNAEFILSGVLTQKIDYDSYKFT